MTFKPFGALYLILGTCIAAGMLGLPIVSADNHFLATLCMLFCAWVLMTVGAWCLLQVTMQMPAGANFITMSKKTLGNTGKVITWFVYLLLLVSLLCAYLSASSDLLQSLFQRLHVDMPRFVATLLSALILGCIVYQGIYAVDIANRFLMSTKLAICLLLIISVAPYAHVSALPADHWHWHVNTLLVMITAFGYGNIIPSIRDYLQNDRKKLMTIFYIGSLIPITLYVVWIFLIQGALPNTELLAMNNSPHTNSLLMHALASLTQHPVIESISVLFVSICSVTGFLSVGLSLFDTLKDGLHDVMPKPGIAGLALLPPMLIVIFYPAIFIQALAYAGMCCLYVLVILPVMMYVVLKRKGLTQEVL